MQEVQLRGEEEEQESGPGAGPGGGGGPRGESGYRGKLYGQEGGEAGGCKQTAEEQHPGEAPSCQIELRPDIDFIVLQIYGVTGQYKLDWAL